LSSDALSNSVIAPDGGHKAVLANTSEREPVRSSKVRFNLMGFDQAAGVRLYAFQGDADGIRTDYTVGVDLALTASHGIRIQELPLLCRELLERQVEGHESHSFSLTAIECSYYADNAALAREASLRKRKRITTPLPL
jgi:hypothetical protein